MSPWITDEDPFSRFIRHLIFQMYFRYKKISCTSHIFKHVSLCSVFRRHVFGSNLSIFFAKWCRNKNKYAFNFEFHTSIFNQGGANRYVLRLIQLQNLKRKIVAVSFFGHRIILMTNSNFQTPLTLSSHGISLVTRLWFKTTKTTTFSEPTGRQLSYGILGYRLKIFTLEQKF